MSSVEGAVDERAEFEKWRNSLKDDHTAHGDACRRSPMAGVYHWESTEIQWQAWQARASLEIPK